MSFHFAKLNEIESGFTSTAWLTLSPIETSRVVTFRPFSAFHSLKAFKVFYFLNVRHPYWSMLADFSLVISIIFKIEVK